MELETERLILTPLTAKQLGLWIENIAQLEEELACSYDAEPIEGGLKRLIKTQISKVESNPDNFIYYSFWFIIRKSDRRVVGSLDFKDIPNEKGEVEIGYGLGKSHEHKGYMTEALKVFCDWGLQQTAISHVIAETESDNLPSQKVLKRCGFIQYKRDNQENTLWWKL